MFSLKTYFFSLIFILLSVAVFAQSIPCNITATAGCCDYTLDMDDSFGDSWNGGFITVNVNGTSVGTFSAAGYGTVSTFSVCSGDAFTITYTSGGIFGYESENTYTLIDPAGTVLFSDGPTPSTGVVFSSSANCGLDCNGGYIDIVASGIGEYILVLDNDFDFGNSGTGWNSTSSAMFNNPCGGAYDGGTYLWMGDAATVPRTLSTAAMDLSCGGQVCFYFKMAVQAQTSPCEGPDQADEGVYFDYWNGTAWVNLVYFGPNGINDNTNSGGTNAQMTTWNQYCYTIPPAGQIPNAMFRWAQTASTNNIYDHWGVDNVTISSQVNCVPYYYDWTHISGAPDSASITEYVTSDTTFTVIYTNGIDSCSTSVFIQVPDAVVASATTLQDESCSGCDGSASCSIISGGQAPYTYQWSGGGGNSANATNLCSGTYTCTVTDANGCDDIVSATISPASTVSANFTYNGDQCLDGNSFDFSNQGTSGVGYSWSFSGGANPSTSTLENPTGIVWPSPGVYNVDQIVYQGTCSTTYSINITVYAAIDYPVTGSDISCFGANDGIVSATTGGLTYNWDNGLPSISGPHTNLGAGTYNVTITDVNGCLDTGSYTVSEPFAMVLTMNSTDANCGQLDGSVSVSVLNGTAPLTYSWSNGCLTSSCTGLGANSYNVTITDGNGCSDIDFSTVGNTSGPTGLMIDSIDANCFGVCDGQATVQVTDGTPPYTYAWSTVPVQTNVTASGLCVGTNSVSIIDVNGCSSVVDVQINGPTPLILNVSSTDPNCNTSCDGYANASVSGGSGTYTYNWNTSPVQTTAAAANLCGSTYAVTVTDGNGCDTVKTVSLTAPSPITYTINATSPSCSYTCDGSSMISPFGGAPPYTYSWNTTPVQTTQTADSLCAGNVVVVTLSDNNGCAISTTSTPTPANPIIASIGNSSDISCYGYCDGYAQLQIAGGNAPYTYSWNTGPTTDQITNLCSGTYIATVTDQNGCEDTSVIVITEPQDLSVVISQTNVSCAGYCDGYASAAVSGGTWPYTYLWNSVPAQTNSIADSLCPGIYSVNVRDNNGCASNKSASIVEPLALNYTQSSFSSTCGSANGSACISPSGGMAPYTVQWNDPDTTIGNCIDSVLAGVYNPVLIDGNGCINSDTVVIINDISGALIDSIVTQDLQCNGDANGIAQVFISSGTSPFTYDWKDISGTSIGMNTNTLFNLSGGTYTISIIDGNNCVSSYAFGIYEPLPMASIIISSSDPTCYGLCDGVAKVGVGNGTQPYTYNWIQSGDTLDISSSLCAGTSNLVVTDANGCSLIQDVVLNNPSIISVADNVTTVSCNGSSDGQISVTPSGGSGPYTYLWQPIGTGNGAQATNLSAGTYTVQVTDSKGCDTLLTIPVSEPSVLVATGTSTPSSCGNANGEATVAPSGGTPTYSYEWFDAAGTPIGQTTPIATGLLPDTYDVLITDANGCTFTLNLPVVNHAGPVISNVNSNDVNCNGGNDGNATVYSSGGTFPYTYSWNDGFYQTTDSAIMLSAGTYGITVSDLNGCADSSLVTISEPSPILLSLSNDTTICIGGTAILSISVSGGTSLTDYAYNWDNGIPDTAEFNVAPASFTTYNITVTDDNGCQEIGSVVVDLYSALMVSVADSVICEGETVTLEAMVSGGNTDNPLYTYVWSDNSTNSSLTITPLVTTSYDVTVGDGCSPNATTTVDISVNERPIVDFVWNCYPDPFVIQFTDTSTVGLGDYIQSWDWDFGDNSSSDEQDPIHNYDITNLYNVSLTVTTDKGCIDSHTMSIQSPPTANFVFMQGSSVINPPEVSTLSPSVDITDASTTDVIQWGWDFENDDSIDTSMGIPGFVSGGAFSRTYTERGLYYVMLTVENSYGCMDTSLNWIRVNGEYVLFAPNTFFPGSDFLENRYFKPRIIGVDDAEFEIFIYDRWGDLIYQYDNSYNDWQGWDGTANSGSEPSKKGVYVWLIRTEDINGEFHEYLGHITLLYYDDSRDR